MGQKFADSELELYRRVDEVLYYVWGPNWRCIQSRCARRISRLSTKGFRPAARGNGRGTRRGVPRQRCDREHGPERKSGTFEARRRIAT